MRASSRTDSKTERLPNIVLILDRDETIAISEKKLNGDYIIQEDGSISFNVPIHVVTARADIPGDRKVVEGIIDCVGGFHTALGGFKREHIHFTSTKKEDVWKPIFTKAEVIDRIHQTFYPNLPKKAFLFVDDMPKYLEDVRKLGYLTFRANPETKIHFKIIEEFILNFGVFYTHKRMLFNNLIAPIPFDKGELAHKNRC